jgi:aryl-alcohol dehydrogenase-like predicted oxidoreductase
VVYTGSSNFAGWNIVQAQHAAHERHLQGLVSEQSLYNLTNRMVELEVIPACAELGIVSSVEPPRRGHSPGPSTRRRGAQENRVCPEGFRAAPEADRRYEFCRGAGKSRRQWGSPNSEEPHRELGDHRTGDGRTPGGDGEGHGRNFAT